MKKAATIFFTLATFSYLYCNQTIKDMTNVGKLNPSYKHGDAPRNNQAKEYLVWCSIRARCYNPNYKQFKDYGGRGITVCDRWRKSYKHFLSDMGRAPSKKHSIERINNNKGYYPKNCKWATKYEQARNTTQNRNITYNGVTKCITDWAEDLGGNTALICKRLKRGWDPKDAITKPIRYNGYYK